MAITVDGHHLQVEDVVKVARHNEPIELHPDAKKRIEKCRALLEDKIRKNEIMYGVNTGIGELSEVVLTPEQVEKYQRYIIYSHAAGYGKPLPDRYRPGGHAQPDQLPLPRPFRLEARRDRDDEGDAQPGGDAGGLRKGLGRRLRGPFADVPGRAGGHGRRGVVL